MSDLIASIKASKLPIICICNDKYKQSLKSLKNHCIEINWNKPTKLQVAKRLQGIAQAEGLSLNQVCSASSEVSSAHITSLCSLTVICIQPSCATTHSVTIWYAVICRRPWTR